MSSPGLCAVCGGFIIRRVDRPVSLPIWNKLTLNKAATNSAKLCNCQPASTTAVSTNLNHQKVKILQNISLHQPQFDNVSDGDNSESEVIELSSDDCSPVVPAELNSRPTEAGKGQSSSVLRSILIGKSFNLDKYRNKHYFGGAGPSRNVVDVPAVSAAGVSSAAEDTAAPVIKKPRLSAQNLREYLMNFNVTQNLASQNSIPSYTSFDPQPVLDDIYQKYDGDVGLVGAVADVEFYNAPTPRRQLGDVVAGAAVVESPAPTAASAARLPDLFDLLNDDVNDVVTNAAVVPSTIPAASVATSQIPRSPDPFEDSDDDVTNELVATSQNPIPLTPYDEFIIQPPTNFADVLRSQPMDGAVEASNVGMGPEDVEYNSSDEDGSVVQSSQPIDGAAEAPNVGMGPADTENVTPIQSAIAPIADWEDDVRNEVVHIEAKIQRFERLLKKLNIEYTVQLDRSNYLIRQIQRLREGPHDFAEVLRFQNEFSGCTKYCDKLVQDIREKQRLLYDLSRWSR